MEGDELDSRVGSLQYCAPLHKVER